MKTNTIQTYTCELCRAVYYSEDKALLCESRPVTGDKGVEAGDLVKIVSGDGAGLLAKVVSVGVHDKEWGHYQWQRYWHTIFVVADIVDDVGSRTLSFDDYEVV